VLETELAEIEDRRHKLDQMAGFLQFKLADVKPGGTGRDQSEPTGTTM
jgi:hypothetical protein